MGRCVCKQCHWLRQGSIHADHFEWNSVTSSGGDVFWAVRSIVSADIFGEKYSDTAISQVVGRLSSEGRLLWSVLIERGVSTTQFRDTLQGMSLDHSENVYLMMRLNIGYYVFRSRLSKDERTFQSTSNLFSVILKYNHFGDLLYVRPALSDVVGSYFIHEMVVDRGGQYAWVTGLLFNKVRVMGQDHGANGRVSAFVAYSNLSQQSVTWFISAETDSRSIFLSESPDREMRIR
ncbi:MAG: hypothetical protein AAGJ35_04510, partial [Myxococcota bacterium]